MPKLFILEDSAQDIRIAEDAAKSVGFESVLGHLTLNAAQARLLASLSNPAELPDALLIDLDLGQESGYEILRLRHSTPTLAQIPAVVWTHLDTHHEELCELFDIEAFVDKAAGAESLKLALTKVLLK